MFTHKRFYTETPLHTNAFTHQRNYKHIYTQTLLHTNFFTHTNTFTHKHLCTQALYSYSQKPISFGHPNIMLCRRVATGPTKLTIKPQLSSIFDTQTSFRAKKLPPDQAKPQTTSGFDTLTQTSFRAKGLPPDQPKSRKTLSF